MLLPFSSVEVIYLLDVAFRDYHRKKVEVVG